MSFPELLPAGATTATTPAPPGAGGGFELLGSPDLFDLGPLVADGPFSDETAGDVRAPAAAGQGYAAHDELQLSPVGLPSVDPSFFDAVGTVPDVAAAAMPVDDADAATAYYQQLQALEIDTPAWAQAEAERAAAAAVAPATPEYPQFETVAPLPAFPTEPKVEPMSFDDDVSVPSVPEAAAPRPKTGPGSRRKVKEEIRDELDHVIYSLFPMDALRLPREAFQKWRETSGIRKLSVPEQRRLAKIRRMILARVYAERTRLRKIAESQQSGQTLTKVKAENSRLRKKVAKLEAVQSKVMEQLKRLMAQQKIHVK